MVGATVALLGGLALGPTLIVFSPQYFPWTLLAAGAAGVAAGLAGGGRTLRAQLARAVAFSMVLFTVAVVVTGRGWMGSFAPALFTAMWWLLLPVAAGALLGALARRRLGAWRALAVSLVGVAGLTIAGALLASTLAPAEVGDAPRCETGLPCARSACWATAERRRFTAVERVVRYDGSEITCTYTGWGGVHIGTATGSGRGSGWNDGWWPVLLRPR